MWVGACRPQAQVTVPRQGTTSSTMYGKWLTCWQGLTCLQLELEARAQSGKRLGSYGVGRSMQHSVIPCLIQNIVCNTWKPGRLTSSRVFRSKRDVIAHASKICVYVKLPRLDTVCEGIAGGASFVATFTVACSSFSETTQRQLCWLVFEIPQLLCPN